MNIKTSAGLWKFPQLLTLAHRANEAIERQAGARSGSVTVTWELGADDNADALLKVTVALRGECMPISALLSRPEDVEPLRQSCAKRFCGLEEKPSGWSAK